MKAIESNNKWYFRTTATVETDDDDRSSIMLPVDQITGIIPGDNNTKVRIHFEAPTTVGERDGPPQQNGIIRLIITAGRQKEVLQFLAEAANSSTLHEGYKTIVDTTTKEIAFKYIEQVQSIRAR